jgi:hypothetical protein
MSNFILTRELIKRIYSKHEAYINPILKFILALVLLSVINSRIGYMERLDSAVIVLVAALLCSFLPMQVMAIIAGLFMLLHMYALAPECAIVVGVLFFLMFILYVRLVPKETIVVLITPILFMLKIPYVMPIAMGLLGVPASVVTVSFGIVIAYFLTYIQNNASSLSSYEDAGMISRIRLVVDGLLGNKAMFATIVVFAIVLILVYVIRRRQIDYAWTIAVITGGVAELVLLFITELTVGLDFSIIGMMFGCILSVLFGLFLQLFAFHVDYKRTENVQFEDDEYYYYVKAVPKVTVAASEKKVKRVQPSQSKQAQHKSRPAGAGSASPKASSAERSVRTLHTANGTSRTLK